MKKRHIALITLLLANSVLGEDGVELLKRHYLIDSAVVTSANLALKLKARELDCSVVQNSLSAPWRNVSEYIANDEAVILTPDRWTWFIDSEGRMMFTPVSFKSKHKGFRVTRMPLGVSAHYSSPEIAYIVLSDTSAEAGEDDVEKVMDNGRWVKVGDSRSLDVEKLGYDADFLIRHSQRIMLDPEYRARMLNNEEYIKIWDMLIDWGVIKTNAESKTQQTPPSREKTVTATNSETPDKITEDGQDEEKSKATTFWLYALIPLCLLAVLWFVRKKRKRDSP